VSRFTTRVEASATPAQKEALERLSPEQVRFTDLAGEKIQTILTHAPGNGAAEGGRGERVVRGASAGDGRHLQDFRGELPGADHRRHILEEAQAIVDDALAAPPKRNKGGTTSGLPQQAINETREVREAMESWRNEGNPKLRYLEILFRINLKEKP
jgi:phosphoglucomutase